MRTTLHLLTRDGAVFLDFRPRLSPSQYSHLLELANAARSQAELREQIREWTREEGIRVSFNEWDSDSDP